MEAKFMVLTPSGARQLKANHDRLPEAEFRNRRIKPPKVNHLVQEIRNGKWDDNAETVKISDEGYIVDGHHRIMACIISSKPVNILMVTGVNKDVFSTIDTGSQRSASDTFYTLGIKNNTNMASITKRLAGHSVGYTSTASSSRLYFTNNDAVNIYYGNKELIEEVFLEVKRFYSTGQHILTVSNATAVAVALILAGEDREMIYTYFEDIFIGSSTDPKVKSTAGRNVRNRIITGTMRKETKIAPSKVGDMLFYSYGLYKKGSNSGKYRGTDKKVTPPNFVLPGYIKGFKAKQEQ